MNHVPLTLSAALWLAGCSSAPSGLPLRAPDLNLGELDISPWQASTPMARYGPEDLELVVGEAALHCTPYDIEEAQVLKAVWHNVEAELILYRCRSSQEAFGLYTALQARAGVGHAVAVGAAATAQKDGVRAWNGRYCLTVTSSGTVPAGERDLIPLARSVIDTVKELSRKPALVRALPVDNLLPGTELYFRTAETLDLVWQFRHAPDLLRLEAGADGQPAASGVYAQYMFTTEANVFPLFYRDPDVAEQVVNRFVEEIYRPKARTFQDFRSLKELEVGADTWALAYHNARLIVLVPPTKAHAEVKHLIRQFVANLAALVPPRTKE